MLHRHYANKAVPTGSVHSPGAGIATDAAPCVRSSAAHGHRRGDAACRWGRVDAAARWIGSTGPQGGPGKPGVGGRALRRADKRGFKRRNIVEIEFLGRSMFVHRAASRHFLRLERLFEARAPEYAAAVALGQLDDWSYENRDVRGGETKSNHSFGIAIDINALTNSLGTAGDMPEAVVRQWEAEGGEWGGDWSRPDPMHFETHLTPEEIRERYHADGTPRAWYLEEISRD